MYETLEHWKVYKQEKELQEKMSSLKQKYLMRMVLTLLYLKRM